MVLGCESFPLSLSVASSSLADNGLTWDYGPREALHCVSTKSALPGLNTVRHEPSRHRPLKVLLDDALDLLVAAAAAGTGARGA
jgi:hypothetical protein